MMNYFIIVHKYRKNIYTAYDNFTLVKVIKFENRIFRLTHGRIFSTLITQYDCYSPPQESRIPKTQEYILEKNTQKSSLHLFKTITPRPFYFLNYSVSFSI